jgi:hypothetical protein
MPVALILNWVERFIPAFPQEGVTMKHAVFTAVVVIASLFFSSAQSVHAESNDSTCIVTGDVDGNLLVNSADVIQLCKLLRDSSLAYPFYLCDVNGDCVVDSADFDVYMRSFFVPPSIPIPPTTTCCNPTVTTSCCYGVIGNVNGSGDEIFNVTDITYLVKFLFAGGPAPLCAKESNFNLDAQNRINLLDLTKAIGFLFGGMGAPPSCYGSQIVPGGNID